MDGKKMTLTVDEIKDLAEFAGLRVKGEIADEDRETEITITTGPEKGFQDEETGAIGYSRHIAYLEEYPEEGVYPLGKVCDKPVPDFEPEPTEETEVER